MVGHNVVDADADADSDSDDDDDDNDNGNVNDAQKESKVRNRVEVVRCAMLQNVAVYLEDFNCHLLFFL